jgi:hypothetical protein
VVNGAQGSQTAGAWINPAHANYDNIRATMLLPFGLDEPQVQVVWLKVANFSPSKSLPDPAADAFRLLMHLGDILRALKARYPNLQMVFVSTRTYGGYATAPINPEPYAYESGFSAKWLIEAQIAQMDGGGIDPVAGDLDYTTVAPWVAWGPYLWADGLNPRSDGLIWELDDFMPDGTHPGADGVDKAGDMLLDFFSRDAHTAPWFLGAAGMPGSISGTAALQGRGDPTGAEVAAVLWNAPVITGTVGVTGSYFYNLLPADYRLQVIMPGYLTAEYRYVELGEAGNLVLPTLEALGGDADGDDEIDMADVSLIISLYGLTCASPGWNPAADINGDCRINIQDLTMTAGNVGQAAPVVMP